MKTDSIFKNNRIVLFGAGNFGKKYSGFFSELGIKVSAITDNDQTKIGKEINGIKIDSLKEILDSGSETVYVITVVNSQELICEQLISAGVNRDRILTLEELYQMEPFLKLLDEKYSKFYKYTTTSKFNLPDNTSMSILFDGQVFAFQKQGGISRYINELLSGLSRIEGNSVYLFKGVNISEVDIDARVNNEFDFRADDVLLNEKTIRLSINKRLFSDYCKERAFSIYHPTYYEDYENNNYKKKIITVHDMIHELFGMSKKTIDEKKRMIESADGIIAISNNTKKDIVELLDIPEERIRVIYHGNSLNYAVGSERLIRDPYILYVGDRSKYKNSDTLVKAYANCSFTNDVKLAFFGGEQFTDTERELFDRLGIADRVLKVGGSDRDLANIYHHAEIFVYPSKYEGFGIPLLEAMHYGVPVITSNVSSMPEISGDAAELFSPDSVEELTEKIELILSDRAIRKALSQKGIQREKQFSWERCVKETYDYYRQVLCE